MSLMPRTEPSLTSVLEKWETLFSIVALETDHLGLNLRLNTYSSKLVNVSVVCKIGLFLICKIEIIIVPTIQCCCKN